MYLYFATHKTEMVACCCFIQANTSMFFLIAKVFFMRMKFLYILYYNTTCTQLAACTVSLWEYLQILLVLHSQTLYKFLNPGLGSRFKYTCTVRTYCADILNFIYLTLYTYILRMYGVRYVLRRYGVRYVLHRYGYSTYCASIGTVRTAWILILYSSRYLVLCLCSYYAVPKNLVWIQPWQFYICSADKTVV